MTPEMLTRLRKQLEDERDSAAEELHSYGADPHSEQVQRIDGIDANFADSAAASAERTEILAFIDKARDRFSGAEEALAKMDAGTYGICEDCGREIPDARLEARPSSVRCVECAAKQG
jgi:DnaK suppressor protein